MNRDTNRTIFPIVGKWGRRRRCRRPFSIPPSPGPSRKREGRRKGEAEQASGFPLPRRGRGSGRGGNLSGIPRGTDLGVPRPVSGWNRKGEEIPFFPWVSDLFIPNEYFLLDSGRVLGYICQSGEVGAPEMPAPLFVARHAAPVCSHVVMPGLVPGIHVLRHRGASQEWARRRRDVDARNKSGHDDGGTAGAARPSSDPDKPREKRRGSRARPCGGHDRASCNRHRYRPGRRPDRATDRAPRDGGAPGRALPRHADPRIEYADPPAPRPRSAFADGNVDRPVESAEVDIPARHLPDANVDPVAICLRDAYVDRRKTLLCAAKIGAQADTPALRREEKWLSPG